MGIGLGSVRGVDVADPAVRRLEGERHHGRPDLAALWAEHGPNASVSVLSALVKADLTQRYAWGERPAAAEYLERFPRLRAESDRVLSLVYEEFCLREEQGERLDTQEFCDRYAEWKDSLESQLKYHRVISGVAGPTPAPPRFPMAGDRFQQFTIGAEIGRGGAARVYLARDESLGGRDVVLKVSADRGSEPSILGRLEHPHIITVHTVATRPEANLRGLCMPYHPGLPLDEVIKRVNPAHRPAKARALWDALIAPRGASGAPPTTIGAPPTTMHAAAGWEGYPIRGSYADGVAWVAATLADALAYAHAQKVFHRDVKPANVLLTYRGGPQLLDFNLSHDPDSAEHAEAALRGGTLPYMAPEQLEAFLDPSRWGAVLASADLYSLGLLTRELLTGRGPETPDTTLPLARAIRAMLDRRLDFQPGLRRANRRIPHALESIVERCLAFNPADRYRDASEPAEDLRRYLARRPLKHTINRSPRERALNWTARHRIGLSVAVAVGAVVTLAFSAPAALERFDGWWTAPETRPAFLQTVAKLDGNNVPAALAGFARLSATDRRQPVVGFYSAAALTRRNLMPEALAAFERACRGAEADATLFEWGRAHPKLFLHAETVGAQMLSSLPQNQSRRVEALSCAERMFGLALRSDPLRLISRRGLAVIDEIRGDFAAARLRLNPLVEENGAGLSTGPRAERMLRDLLQQRVRLSIRWARNLLGLPGDPAEALSHAVEAVADLDRAERLVHENNPDERFAQNGLRCEAFLTLSEIAFRRGEMSEALRFAREAKQQLSPLKVHPPEQDASIRSFLERIETRLKALDRPASNPT